MSVAGDQSSTLSRQQSRKEHDEKAQDSTTSELLNRNGTFQDALFGVLYTIGKEKYTTSWKIALSNILLDFVQILLFIVNKRYPWNINYDGIIFRWFTRLNLKNPIVGFGYTSFQALFYLGMTMLVSSSALCAYVAYNFKTDSFPYVWPIKALRFFVSIFLEAFYISSLNVFLVGPDCNLVRSFTIDGVVHRKGYSDTFQDVKCLGVPNVFMFVIGIACACLAALISYFLVVTSAEQDLNSKNLLSASHSRADSRIWLAKTTITLVAVLLSNHHTVQGVYLLLVNGYLCYTIIRKVPYNYMWINLLRSGFYATLCFCSLMLLLLIQKPGQTELYTAVTIGLAVPVGLCAAGVCYMRLRYANRTFKKFAAWDAEDFSECHKFIDAFEVEIVSRGYRKKDSKGQYQEDLVNVAEDVIKEGIRQFPDSSFLVLYYSNFLLAVRKNVQGASIQLSRARKIRSNLSKRFMIFVRDRERKQRSGTEQAGSGTMDLVSYVEFQNNYRAILASHMAALKSVRQFWRELLKKEVTFSGLSRAFSAMEQTEAKAEKVYRVALERYPKSVKLLRTYSKFLEDVRNDPWAAGKFQREAERLEDVQNEAQRDLLVNQAPGAAGGDMAALVDDSTDAVVVASDLGIIQFANRPMYKLFGYKRGELEGKNVSILMPSPFSQNHNQYMRNYKASGRSTILNKARDVVALHKLRHVFVTNLTITKIQQGESEAFLGAFRTMPESDTAEVYLTPQGLVLCTNRSFQDLFGYRGVEVVGKNFARLIATDIESFERQLKVMTDFLERLDSVAVAASRGSRHEDEGEMYNNEDEPDCEFETMARHKYGNTSFKVSISASVGGTSNARMIVVKMQSLESTGQGVVAIDEGSGMISYCSSSVEAMLGYHPGTLGGSGNVPLSKILPPPYNLMHQKFVQDFARNFSQSGVSQHRFFSCASGGIVQLQGKDGKQVPVSLSLSMMPEGDRQLIFSATVQPVTMFASQWIDKPDAEEVKVASARLRLIVDKVGNILLADAPPTPQVDLQDAPAPLFGIFREDLAEGYNLADLLDVFTDAVTNARLLNPETRVDQVLPPLLKRISNQSEDLGVGSWRCGVNAQVGLQMEGFTPAVMVLGGFRKLADLSPLAMASSGLMESVGEASELLNGELCGDVYLVDLYPEGKLQGVVELTKDGMIRKADRITCLLLGNTPDGLTDTPLSSIMSNAPPASRLASKFGLKLGKQLGDKTPIEITRPDKASFQGVALMCLRGEARLQALISSAGDDLSDNPIGSYRRLQELLFGGPASVGAGGGKFQMARSESGKVRFESHEPSGGAGVSFGAVAAAMKAAKSFKAASVRGGNSKVSMGSDYENPMGPIDDLVEDPDAKGSAPAESDANNEDEDDDHAKESVNLRRAKKFKRLKRLLSSAKAWRSVNILVILAKVTSVLILALHVASYASITVMSRDLSSQVSTAPQEGDMRFYMHDILITMRQLATLDRFYPASRETDLREHLDLRTTQFETVTAQIYKQALKKPGYGEALREFAERYTSSLLWIELQDAGRRFYQSQFESTWDQLRNIVRSARLLYDVPAGVNSNITGNIYFKYLFDNAPEAVYLQIDALVDTLSLPVSMKYTYDTINAARGFYMAQGVALVPVCGLILYLSIKRVLYSRINLYSVFLYLPRPMVLSLATKEIRLDEDDEDEEGDDDVEMERLAMAETKGGKPGADDMMPAGSGVKIRIDASTNKRQLKSSSSMDVIRLTAPFAFYTTLLLISICTMTSLLKNFREPMETLHNSLDLYQLNSRMQYYTHELILTRDDDQRSGMLLHELNQTLLDFMLIYDSILLGSHQSLQGNDIASINITSGLKPNKKSIVNQKAYQSLLFGSGCMRFVPPSPECLPLDDPHYALATGGLDAAINNLQYKVEVMMYEYSDFQNMTDPVNGDTYLFLRTVGRYDIQDGLNRFTQFVLDDVTGRIKAFQSLNTGFLVLFCIGNAMYIFLIQPFVKMTSVESHRVAELMSLLPDNLDVETLVIQAGGIQDDENSGDDSLPEGDGRRRRKKRGFLKRLLEGNSKPRRNQVMDDDDDRYGNGGKKRGGRGGYDRDDEEEDNNGDDYGKPRKGRQNRRVAPQDDDDDE